MSPSFVSAEAELCWDSNVIDLCENYSVRLSLIVCQNLVGYKEYLLSTSTTRSCFIANIKFKLNVEIYIIYL